MRPPKYLSPTSIGVFLENPETFYQQYLSDSPPPRPKQLQVMSVGSAFDAYVKSYLYRKLVGHKAEYEFDAMFTSQVEEHNRDWAREAGALAFGAYQSMGGLADLLAIMEGCIEPRFEFRLEGQTSRAWDHHTPPLVLMGKPDLHFKLPTGVSVLLDWKVNGFCSKKKPSPTPGYLNYLPTGKAHRDALPVLRNGVKVNAACPLDLAKVDWARQLAIYGWLLGEDIGAQFLTAIDQIVCENGTIHGVAQHRTVISPVFQEATYATAAELWKRCHAPFFFLELGEEKSLARQKQLDTQMDYSFLEARG